MESQTCKGRCHGLKPMYIQLTYDHVGTISDKGSPIYYYINRNTLWETEVASNLTCLVFLDLILVSPWYKLATLSYLTQEFCYPHKTSKTIATPNIHPKALACVYTLALYNLDILTLQWVSWCLSTSSLRNICYGPTQESPLLLLSIYLL